MAEITQTISSLPVVEGRYGSDFIQQADAFLNTLPNWSPQLNYFARQANDLRDEVNGFRNTTYNYMATTKNYMNSAYAYKTDAESAANAIKSYVIPEEATYSKDDLDSNHNSLLTALTATQAQVSTIANFLPELADYKLRNVDSKYVKEKVKEQLKQIWEESVAVDFDDFGYIVLPNGLIIQWFYSSPPEAAYYNVILPIAFPHKCLSASAVKASGDNGVVEADLDLNNSTNTYLRIAHQYTTKNDWIAGYRHLWIAIGY